MLQHSERAICVIAAFARRMLVREAIDVRLKEAATEALGAHLLSTIDRRCVLFRITTALACKVCSHGIDLAPEGGIHRGIQCLGADRHC